MNTSDRHNEIAIIGMTCRFPGASDVEAFWLNLRDGVESVTTFSDEELLASGVDPQLLRDPRYVRRGPVLEGVELFDAPFFDFTSREAEITDPQQRIFLECAWEALEKAGYDSERYDGLIGVYAGTCANSYLLNNLYGHTRLKEYVRNFQVLIGNDKDYLATRVSYKLNLKGPSVVIQSACSTSLVAVHMACESLLGGECDLALAGGVTVKVPQRVGYLYEEGAIGSPDGHCRAFDAEARGTVAGSGGGVVVLKRLAEAFADGDHVHAVIKGSAVNNDGSRKVGYTAPSARGQAEVIAGALTAAEVGPETVSYVETHGTGTSLGDPIEIDALAKAFRAGSGRASRCAIGSVKTNVGHLDTAAGMAGLIKTVLALEHRQIPPSLNFVRPNPEINFDSTPFYVNTKLSPWEPAPAPRRAGVSSFGIGGTNAHLILEEAPAAEESGAARGRQLILLSAKTETALDSATHRLAEHLEAHGEQDLADVAYTLQLGRRRFSHRRALVCRDREEAIRQLRNPDAPQVFTRRDERRETPVVFIFPGHGSQYARMGRGLYEAEPTFRREVDLCSELLRPQLGLELRRVLYPAEGSGDGDARLLDETFVTQPALFAVEFALARLWQEWGVRPQAMIGHSLGEYVAACVAGVLSLEDALTLVAARGRLTQSVTGGAMLAVKASEEELRPQLFGGLCLAAVNSPSHCTVAGPAEEVAQLQRHLNEQGIGNLRLRTPHAFHSALLNPIKGQFLELVRRVTLSPPRMPYLSNVTGDWIMASEATDPDYWGVHLCQTVRFGEGVGKLLSSPGRILLAMGHDMVLGPFIRKQAGASGETALLSSLRRPDEEISDVEFSLRALGHLWARGVPTSWEGFHVHERRRRVLLPAYPFERRRYWVDPPRPAAGDGAEVKERAALARKPDIADWFYLPTWKRSMPPANTIPRTEAEEGTCRVVFVDASGVGLRLVELLRERGLKVCVVKPGTEFGKLAEDLFTIDPTAREHYVALLEEFSTAGLIPRVLVHLGGVTPARQGGASDRTGAEGFQSLLSLAQALGEKSFGGPIQLRVITDGVQQVESGDVIRPEKSLMLGPCRVLPQEYPFVACQNVDIVLPVPETPQFERLLGQLVAELSAEPQDAVVAYRGSHRWVQAFEPVRLSGVESISRLKEAGVYLITGGLGGIGLELAGHLAKSVRARLALLGRSEFPDVDGWERWLTTHGEDDVVSQRILKLRGMERGGAQIMTVSADVADAEQMRAAVSRIVERFGRLDGVIHAAGVAGGHIQRKTAAPSAEVLSPKVEGTAVLRSVLKGVRLDFVVLCSSTVSLTGGVGQADYCAANAALDAFAHAAAFEGSDFTVSINWGPWRDVGMASETHPLLRHASAQPPSPSQGKQHPLLGRLVFDAATRAIYLSEFKAEEHWVLSEHKIAGEPVIPGTAYLEMLAAAMKRQRAGACVELREVLFLRPVVVREGQSRKVLTVIDRKGEGFDFLIVSAPESSAVDKGARWIEHARGKISLVHSRPPASRSLGELEQRTNVKETTAGEERKNDGAAFVDLGPRWRSLKRVRAGLSEDLAYLELPEEYSSDLEEYELHPALLDVASGAAALRCGRGHYLPLSYGRLRIHGPLPRKVYSHVLHRDSNSPQDETLTFDIVIFDESGRVLVEIEQLTLKKVSDAFALSKPASDLETRVADLEVDFLNLLSEGEAAWEGASRGISPAEGVEAFRRILAAGTVPQIIVSAVDFGALREQINKTTAHNLFSEADAFQPLKQTHPRPELSAPFVAPRGNTERTLAEIWGQVLGVESVGVQDDFFELGGDSISGLQVVTRARAAGLEVSPGQVFRHPTVAELASVTSHSDSQISGDVVKDRSPEPEKRVVTPEDFPAAGLSQEELERLVASFSKDDVEQP